MGVQKIFDRITVAASAFLLALIPYTATAQTGVAIPFYEQVWFYVLLVLFVILLLVITSLLRTRRLSSSKRELEGKVQERTRELLDKQRELKRLSIVAKEISDSVVIAEADGTLIWANDSFTKMSGYTLEEYCAVFGDNYFDNTGNDEIKNMREKAISGDVIRYEFSYVTKAGDTKWTLCKVNPVSDENHTVINFILIYTDITEQKKVEGVLRQKNKDITDSIVYAKQIQEAILPDKVNLFKHFPESFIFLQPRDIVSGDFYWFSKIGRVFVVVAADCTGHGVPGAMMSMMGNEYLHQIVNNRYVTGPDQALHQLDSMIKRGLHQHGDNRESKDGMDLIMAAIHLDNLFCQCAGAQNPLLLVRNGELITYEGTKESLGGYSKEEKNFFAHEFDLISGDVLYLFSDGFMDQFGGPRGKKYYRRRFNDFLLSISHESMIKQRMELEREFEEWKGDLKQVDDVLVMGLRIP